MSISKIDLKSLSNDKHFQFGTDFCRAVEKVGAGVLKIETQFAQFKSLHLKEDNTMKKIIKSEYSALIQNADKARDNAYYGMVEINTAMLRHHNPEITRAATRLKILFDTYGNIAKQTLLAQTSSAHNILQELTGKYLSDTKIVRIDDWVEQLAVCNKEINELMDTRVDENAAKSNMNLRDLRTEIDAAYRGIIERIDALVILDFSPAVEEFMRTINEVIRKYTGKTGTTANRPQDNADSGTGHQNQVKPWDANEDYTQMSIGDKRRTADGRIWEAIDLGQVHRDPCGEFGHFGWKLVS